jgi:hypothetical protein
MEKVQKPSNSECYTLLSEPFRIYWNEYEYVNRKVCAMNSHLIFLLI